MKYFTIEELCASSTAKERGIDNSPTREVIANLTLLVEKVLDPLRVAYCKPIRVNSGYRCEALNKAVGGVETSFHLFGCAADIIGSPNTKAENKSLFDLFLTLEIPFSELINESDFSWVHISYKADRLMGRVSKITA